MTQYSDKGFNAPPFASPAGGQTAPEKAAWQTVGISPTTNWAEQDERLKQLWDQGLTPAKIAEALGRTEAAVMTRAARIGLPRRFAPGRKAQSPNVARPTVKREARTRSTASFTNLAEPVAQIVERVCLMCLTKFPSVGRHNRICNGCKDTNEYRNALEVTEYNVQSRS